MEKLSGADILIRALQDEGVEYVFGYPGGAVLHIYDALFKQNRIQHVLVRHEQAATHMADGYARSTGRPGVVFVGFDSHGGGIRTGSEPPDWHGFIPGNGHGRYLPAGG